MAIELPGLFPGEHNNKHRNTCVKMFTTRLFIFTRVKIFSISGYMGLVKSKNKPKQDTKQVYSTLILYR